MWNFAVEIEYYSILFYMSMLSKGRESSKASNALYEHVLTKNFQIIETFLSQFNQLFQKQDQFQIMLNKLDHRMLLAERSNKKMEDVVTKSNELYERKMKSLKQFILEKVKNSNQKVQFVQVKKTAREAVQQQEEDGQKNTSFKSEKRVQEPSKLQQRMNDQIKKLEWQLTNVIQRTASLSSLTNSMDEKIQNLVKQQNNSIDNRFKEQIIELKTSLQDKVQQVSSKLNASVGAFSKEINIMGNKLGKLGDIEAEIGKITGKVMQKLSISQFSQFKMVYEQDQMCMIKQINETFANKKQTKHMILLLEKKLHKLQVIEQIVKDDDENKCNINVVPAFFGKRCFNSIHSVKKDKKEDKNLNKSMSVRRISHHKFQNVQKFL